MKLRVYELENGKNVHCGDYEFSHIPAKDDRILVEKDGWGRRHLKVLYLIHLPDKHGLEDSPIVGSQTCVSVIGECDRREPS